MCVPNFEFVSDKLCLILSKSHFKLHQEARLTGKESLCHVTWSEITKESVVCNTL